VSSIADAAKEIRAAIKLVPKVTVVTDPQAAIVPPAAILAPPTLSWDGYQVEPTSATFRVIVAASKGSSTIEELWELVPAVAAAIDEHLHGASVRSANPTVWTSAQNDYPAYEITVEVSLT
jgi:uracil phosphoribosyltransferase